MRRPSLQTRRHTKTALKAVSLLAVSIVSSRITTQAFCPSNSVSTQRQRMDLGLAKFPLPNDEREQFSVEKATKFVSTIAVTAAISASIMIGLNNPALAENELSAKYGGKGFDTSLVDQTCLVDKCSLQAKACLADDPDCRKGLTCTAKCKGDNTCITGCMARYGDENLDNLLKCTIEDNECIKIAILDGGADKYGEEPRSPAPAVRNFNMNSLEGQWYKVVGFNPNYDCYACQKNSFSVPDENSPPFRQNNKLEVDVQFSMPRMLPDGTPPPPKNERESVIKSDIDGFMYGSQSIGFNDYQTHEVMVFDKVSDPLTNLVMGKGSKNEVSYSRTAHTQGEMFGLKFWENWYIIGENDPGQQEFKFVYYNGKTRQNTYEGAFVYSRTKELDMNSMKKVYKIASDADMNPDQFCKIRNGCFKDETLVDSGINSPNNPFRGILASTRVSQILGVEPVAAEGVFSSTQTASDKLRSSGITQIERKWWHEVGDYLENPHRHFEAMDSLRVPMDWPEEVKNQ
eukprot:CAMPEP_0203664460 /NCGR_PEP_ID=MMETSP0090-20130426/1864_1 /ASSEMBLY_ACC=CAM_ASM_001088 /TAXON_ID=426623 /ORGANISM="Chaetoceros affinis, Strain CCMP159" /LENGTH=515 /DNA_ID=CAMNT_0050527709 /DNA_START=162 /DNA_END=1709 /DNA_ORIENTATION=+